MISPPKAIVRFNDFQAQWRLIGPDVIEAVERVGRSGWLVLGDEVAQFERNLAIAAGVKSCVGCGSGLDAIEIGLRTLDLQRGDQVITTPLSAFATTLAIIRAGGVPVFIDVDHSGLLNLDKVEEYLDRTKTAAFLLPVHLYGHSLDLQRLLELKEKHNLRLLEDCAQAFGASSGGRQVGTVSQVAATSFYPTKNLACMGDGGALFTSSDEHAARARMWRNYGQTEKYLHVELGMNSRLDELQAAIMSAALLPRLSAFTQRRQAIARTYRSAIANPLITIPNPPTNSDSVYHLFPVLINADRTRFRDYLQRQGVETVIHYPTLLPEQPALRGVPLLVHGDLALAQRFAGSEVSLPIHPYLCGSDIERVVEACNSWKDS